MCLLNKSNYFPPAKEHCVHWCEFDCLMLGFMSMTQANVQAPGWHRRYSEVSYWSLCASLALLSSDWKRWASTLLLTSNQGSLPFHSHCLSMLIFFPLFSVFDSSYTHVHIRHLFRLKEPGFQEWSSMDLLDLSSSRNLPSIDANTAKYNEIE